MKCLLCGQEMEYKEFNHQGCWGDKPFSLRVWGHACPCGHTVLEPEVVREIEKVCKGIDAQIDVYKARERGREYCKTEGSKHYFSPGVEPMDLIISCGYAEHHCLANIIKYAVRFGEGGNLKDLKKIADYAHILCGVRLAEEGEER